MEKLVEQLLYETVSIANTTAHFMGLAEKYLAEGNTEMAKACLIALCRRCANYEESLEWNGLTEQWQIHRHLVDGLVPSSRYLYSSTAKVPSECTLPIQDILSLPDDELLTSLSVHLSELCGNGDSMNLLNQWERTVYYADELCMEIHSGGFDSYLYYHGTHFHKAYSALDTISAKGVVEILEAVLKKFPKGRIPKSEDSLQNTMDKMADHSIDFEAEDDRFYNDGVNELLSCLVAYVKENAKHFR